MNTAITLLIGAGLGVVADIFLRKPLLRCILRLRRLFARLLKREDPLGGERSQLRFGNVTTSWVSLHGIGEVPMRADRLTADLIDEFAPLPSDLAAIRDRRREELEQKARETRGEVWNGQRFSLVSVIPTRYDLTEEPGLEFEFKKTDYAAFLGLTLACDEPGLLTDEAGQPTTIREKYFSHFDPEKPNPVLTHSFGVNLCAITNDSKILFTQRNAHVTNKRQCYHISMNEGMQYPTDIDERGRPSFLLTAIRGLWEELGIEPAKLRDPAKAIEFLNFGALSTENEYALLGRVRLPMKSAEVQQSFQHHAKDKGMETRHELHAVDYLPDQILDFVKTHSPWTPNGLATIYYCMVRQWGGSETRQALTRHPFPRDVV